MSGSELTDNDLTFTTNGNIVATSNLTLQNSTSTTFTWPTTDPAANGYVLSSTTGGTMSWVAPTGSPTGTVTQITSITTGVTLNTASGVITTVSSILAPGNEVFFTVTNSTVLATSIVILTIQNITGSTGTPVVSLGTVGAGFFNVSITNLGALALNSTMNIHFVVL